MGAPGFGGPSADPGITTSHTAAIALGSNLSSPFGTPTQNLEEALRRLATLGRITAASTFHRTAPVGYLDQPDFLNSAALLETTLLPHVLLQALLAIESAMGRDRVGVPLKGPRIIDLDLLLYDQLTLVTKDLTVPHPTMHTRRFVLAPLAEVAPTWLHPVIGQAIQTLLARLQP